MSKYIDADKLLAHIDAKIQELGLSGSTWSERRVLHDLRSDIASLQQEQQSEYVRKNAVTSIIREYLENWLDAYKIERLIDKIEEL